MGAALLVVGCIPSLNPFYTEKDLVSDKRIVGEWIDKSESKEVWKFEEAENKGYKFTYTEKEGKTGEFDAKLFKLGKEYFIDLIPSKCDFATNQADLVAFAVFPGHLLIRVTQFEPELKLAFTDLDWLSKALEKDPSILQHHVEDKRVVLTASTKDLQKFVLKHLTELFPNESSLTRKKPDVK
jgi:hypothetical protein